MAGDINKFEKKISLMVKDKQFLKKYNKIWKKIERLMSIDFESKTTFGDDDDDDDYDKYIKPNTKTYKNV